MPHTETYQETIRTPLWLSLVLAGLGLGSLVALVYCALGWEAADLTLRLGVGALAAATLFAAFLLVLCFGRMSLRAEREKVVVHLGFLPLLRTEISWDDIASAKAVRFRPIRHFGGWGLRAGLYQGVRTVLYAPRGTKGVLLVLNGPIDTPFVKTDHIIVGSQQPLEFAEYLLSHLPAASRA